MYAVKQTISVQCRFTTTTNHIIIIINDLYSMQEINDFCKTTGTLLDVMETNMVY